MAVGRPAFVSSQFLCHPDAGGISFAHFLRFFLRQNDKGGGVCVARSLTSKDPTREVCILNIRIML